MPADAVGDVPTRERILRAATRLFQTRGYHGARLSEILDVAHAPKGSLYHHFPGGKEDLAIASPYNTRLNPGLPPGPIANPGLASIEAVANPTKTKLYYFVADSKKADGSHVFAETLEQHQANIARVGQ